MTNIVSLSPYKFILLPIALGLLLPTLLMPWVIINFQGVNGLTPLDLMRGSYGRNNNDSDSKGGIATAIREHPELVFLDLVSSYKVEGAYAFWISTYLASIVAMILSIVFQRLRTRIAVIAGSLAIAAAITWFYSIEELKINFAEQAAMTGGLIGEEFKGNERTLIDTIVRMGFGPYVAMPAGALAILFNSIKHYSKRNNRSDRHLQEKDKPT